MRAGKVLLGWQVRTRERRLSHRSGDRVVRWIALGTKTALAPKRPLPPPQNLCNDNLASLAARRAI